MGNVIEKAFLNQIQLKNREKVRNSPASEPGPCDTIIGYEFEKDGCYRTFYFHDIKEVVHFIKSSEKDKLLCNSDDYAVACCIGEYVDLAISKEYTEMLVETEIFR